MWRDSFGQIYFIMAESPRSSVKSGGLFKKLGIGVGVFLILLVGIYLVGTSSGFLKSVVLPRVGAALHATVTADEIHLSPFSSVQIRGLRVITVGETPLLTVMEIRARYHLFDILAGKISVDEVTMDTPVLQIVPTADGKDNLQPLLAGDAAPAKPNASSRSPALNIRSVTLRNGSVRQVTALPLTRERPKGGQQVIELANVAVSLDQLAAGQSGKLIVSAEPKLDQGAADRLQGKLQLQLDLALTAASQPQSIKGSGRTDITTATGTFARLAGFTPLFEVEVSPSEVKQVSLRFEQSGKAIPGVFNLAGPFDISKREGRLKLELTGVDRQVLDAVGAAAGLEFGATKVGFASDLEIAQGGNSIHASGAFTSSPFSVVQKGQTLPSLDLNANFDLQADLAGSSAKLGVLNLQALQTGRPLVSGSLSAPMTLAWGGAAANAADAAFQLVVTNLSLPDWKALTGDALTAGRAAGVTRVIARNGGKSLQLESDLGIADLSLQLGSRPFSQGDLRVSLRGQLTEFRQLSLEGLKVDLTQSGQPALAIEGAAGWNFQSGVFSSKTAISVVADRLLGSGPKQSLTLTLASEGSLLGKVLELKKFTATLPSTPRAPSNEFSLSGRLDQNDPAAQIGALTVQSTTLDLTSLYEVFAGAKSPATATPATPAPGGGLPRVEPSPVVLPFKPLTLDAKVGKLFLGEVALTELQATLSINGGKVRISPLQLLVNGAPVKAGVDLDLGGIAPSYAVNWQISGIPLEPLVNTFAPTMKGQAKGQVFGTTQIQGIGITGTNLQKNLAGSFMASVTNANIQVASGSQKVLFLPLDLNSLASMLNIPELTRSPITQIDLRANASGGRIELSQAMVKGDAFLVSASGGVRISEVLESSPILVPLEISLAQAIAQRANLLPANTPTNAVYAKLPAFATVAGTLGKVETKTDRLQLLQITTRAASGLLGARGAGALGGVLGGVGEKVNSLTGTLGGLLGGAKPAATNAASAGSTNKPAPFNPLDLLKKKR